MGKCITKFLDGNGNPAKEYYDILNTEGEEAALASYLSYASSIKFQKNAIDSNIDSIKKKEAEKPTGYKGVTRYLETLTSKFDREGYLDSVAKIQLRKYIALNKGIHVDAIENYNIESEFKNPAYQDIIKTIRQNAADELAVKTLSGTIIHKMFELSVNKLIDKYNSPEFLIDLKTQKDSGANIEQWINSSVVGSVMDEIITELYNSKFEYSAYNTESQEEINIKIEGKSNLQKVINLTSGLNLLHATKLVRQLYNKIYSLQEEHNNGEPFSLLPEQNIYHDNSKIRGIIDLMLISNDGKAILIDFKTKSEKNLEKFEASYGKKFTGSYAHVPKSSKELASLQLSMYSKMIEDQYGITPLENYIAGIPLFTEVDYLNPKSKIRSHLSWGNDVESFYEEATDHTEAVKNDPVFNIQDSEELKAFQTKNSLNNIIDIWSGGIEYDITGSNSVEAFIKYAKPKIYPKGNEKFCFFKNYKYSGDFSDASIENWLRETYNSIQETNKNLTGDIITLFNDTSSSSKTIKEYSEVAGFLLDGISKDTHTLKKANQLPGMKNIGSDVLIAKHKITGEITFLSVLAIPNQNLSEQNLRGTESRTSIYGKYKTDTELQKIPGIAKTQNTVFSFVQVKLAMAAMLYKQHINAKAKIGYLKIGSFSGISKEKTAVTAFESMIPKVKFLAKFSDTDLDDYTEIKSLISSFSINHDPYNPLKILLDLINNGKDPLSELNKYSALKYTSKIKEASEAYDKGDLSSYAEIRTSLLDYVRSLRSTLSGSKAVVEDNPQFKMINALVYDFLEFKRDLSDVIKDDVISIGRASASNSGDPISQKLHLYFVEEEAKTRTEQNKFISEHNKILKELIKEKGLSPKDFISYDKHDVLFSNMFKTYDFSDVLVDKWMYLKDETDNSLSSAERKYIKYFNETIKNSFTKVNSNAKLPNEGLVPLMPSDSVLDYVKCKTKEEINAVTSRLFTLNGKRQGEDDYLKYEYIFDGERGDESLQGSNHRRSLLGINTEGDIIDRTKTFGLSRNLSAILNMVALESNRVKGRNEVLEIHNTAASFLRIKNKELNGVVDLSGSIKLIDMWAKLVVAGEVEVEGKFGKLIDTIKSIASTTVFAGSVGQAMTEAITNITQTSSLLTSLTIQQALGNKQMFSKSTLLWAKAQGDKIFKDSLHYKVINSLGLINPDTEVFKDSVYNITKHNNLLQTKHAYAMAGVFIQDAMSSITLAFLKEKGILDAYSINEDGDLIYDENKDDRFFTGKNPITETEKTKKLFYEYYKEQLAKEGSIDKEGKIVNPLTSRDAAGITNAMLKITGSNSKAESVMFEKYSIGRAFLVYKRWFTQKAVNYSTRRHTSEIIGKDVWVSDPTMENGGYFTWKGEEVEGIFQTCKYILNDIIRISGVYNPKEINESLSPVQKENLSKLLSDLLIHLLAVTVGAYLVDELTAKEYKQTTTYKQLSSSMNNALSDLFILKAGQQLFIEGSPFMAVSVLMNKTATIIDGAYTLVNSNSEEDLKNFQNKVWRITGATKSIAITKELFNYK